MSTSKHDAPGEGRLAAGMKADVGSSARPEWTRSWRQMPRTGKRANCVPCRGLQTDRPPLQSAKTAAKPTGTTSPMCAARTPHSSVHPDRRFTGASRTCERDRCVPSTVPSRLRPARERDWRRQCRTRAQPARIAVICATYAAPAAPAAPDRLPTGSAAACPGLQGACAW